MATAELRSRLAGIDAQILTLQADRASIVAQLSAVVYPVLSLPNEVTGEIFLRYADDYPTSTDNPMILTRVCSLWRTIAVSTPRLWTRFDSGEYRDLGQLDNSAHLADFLGMWLSRTGAQPLDLRIQLPSPETSQCGDIFGVLGDNAARLRDLHLYSAANTEIPAAQLAPLTSLTKLSLRSDYADVFISGPLDAPLLREVELASLGLPFWEVGIPWNQLTTLRLYNQNIMELLDLVEVTSNLEVLEFMSDGYEPEDPFTGPPRALPHLHTLILGPLTGSETLPHLMLPALRELRIWRDIGTLGDMVANLITRSGCSLTTLTFSVYESSDVDAMQSCLLLTPALRELEITCREITSEALTAFVTVFRVAENIVPALASLQLHNCQTKVQLPSLVEMLTARRERGSLRTFKMDFAPASLHRAGGVENAEVDRRLEQLHNLRSGGLEVDIQPEAQWLDGYVF